MSDITNPPTPDGVPFLGNGLAFSRDPFGAVERWARLGDVVQLSFPGRPMYLITSPALIREILIEQQDRFVIGREQRRTFRGVEDNALTANTGDRWRRLRRALQPAFTWENIASYGGKMAERTAAHVEKWDDAKVDLHQEMRLLTMGILGDTLLGVDVEGDEQLIMDAADALIERADPRRFGQILPAWIPTPTERRFERRVSLLDGYVDGVLDRQPAGEDDVRSVLLAAHNRGDLTMPEVRDNLVGLLLAGHDSSAVTLTYAWYELSRHPEIRESLVNQVDEVIDGLPDADDFDSLQRVRHVIRETLRLYPPVWAVNRQTTESVTLGGYEIPAEAQLMIPQWALHRDDRYWEQPETFDPDRWIHPSSRPEYAYFPFSGGPRHCIGMRFARLELTMALATMIDRVMLDVNIDGPLAFQPSLTLRPTVGIEATVTRR